MSFESFLTYDAPTPVKKKKKPNLPSSTSHGRPSHSSSTSSSRQPSSAPVSSSSSSKASKSNGAQSTKRPHSGSSSSAAAPTPEKRKRVSTNNAFSGVYNHISSQRKFLWFSYGRFAVNMSQLVMQCHIKGFFIYSDGSLNPKYHE